MNNIRLLKPAAAEQMFATCPPDGLSGLELDPFPASGKGSTILTLMAFLERANLSHWTAPRLHLSGGPDRVGISRYLS
jgi:hypothetical protein